MVRANKKAEAAEDNTSTEEKPKRKNLTAAERVAKLEADLQAARDKAAESGEKRKAQLEEQKAKLTEQIDERRRKIADLDVELERLAVPTVHLDVAEVESTDED